MKRIYAIPDWCVDCKRCEIACKAQHSPWPGDIVKAFKLAGDDIHNRVRVEGDSLLSFASNCRHCAKPKCIEGCISGAMQRDPQTGVVTSDPARCVGCRTCVSMCPFGAITVVPSGVKSVALKCDLCGDGAGTPGEPSCVAACPNRALIYVESEAN